MYVCETCIRAWCLSHTSWFQGPAPVPLTRWCSYASECSVPQCPCVAGGDINGSTSSSCCIKWVAVCQNWTWNVKGLYKWYLSPFPPPSSPPLHLLPPTPSLLPSFSTSSSFQWKKEILNLLLGLNAKIIYQSYSSNSRWLKMELSFKITSLGKVLVIITWLYIGEKPVLFSEGSGGPVAIKTKGSQHSWVAHGLLS